MQNAPEHVFAFLDHQSVAPSDGLDVEALLGQRGNRDSLDLGLLTRLRLLLCGGGTANNRRRQDAGDASQAPGPNSRMSAAHDLAQSSLGAAAGGPLPRIL